MKKILVPTDFSDHAANALRYGVELAKEINATLYVLHASRQLDTSFARHKRLIGEHNQNLLQEAKTKMEVLKQSIAETENIKIETCIYDGEPEETILYFSEQEDIELIVMSTKGGSGLSNIIGTVTRGVMQRAATPVLVIPNEYRWKTPSKILFATKHFEQDQQILEPVVFFAKLFNAKISVIKFSDEDTAEAIDFLVDSELLFGYIEKLQNHYPTIQIEAKHLSGSKLDETLKEHINDDAVDMLVMVTYQRTFLERLFYPSNTKRMALYTRVPLMIIPFTEKFISKNTNDEN